MNILTLTKLWVLAILALVFAEPVLSQDLPGWKFIGTVKPKSVNEIKNSNWIIGCETLDRDYADFQAYKSYLPALGIKRIRLQGGWAKTEKVKGVYDFAWLDEIVDDARSIGLTPWLELSYGNPIYPGGGGANLSAGLPSSFEALAAWDVWVKATVSHFKNRVKDWEIWNEPNNIPENKPENFAALTTRTIDIIKQQQPEAKISALALGSLNLKFAEKFVALLAANGRLKLIDNITYHGYCKNPDSHYLSVDSLKIIVNRYRPGLKIRQGENGAPSRANMGGAIGDYDWSELSQAKWDTRRMLGDLGRDIESSVFTIIDLAYNNDGPIKKLNVKGLLMSDGQKKVIKPKLAYFAVQHVASIFDGQLSRRTDFSYQTNVPDSLAVFAYQNKHSGQQLVTVWKNGGIPLNENRFEKINLTIKHGKFFSPVYVDIISGKIFAVPVANWKKIGSDCQFSNIPIYDAPILIADKSLVEVSKN